MPRQKCALAQALLKAALRVVRLRVAKAQQPQARVRVGRRIQQRSAARIRPRKIPRQHHPCLGIARMHKKSETDGKQDVACRAHINHHRKAAHVAQVVHFIKSFRAAVVAHKVIASVARSIAKIYALPANAKHKVLSVTLAHGLNAGVHFVQPSTAAADCEKAILDGYRFIALGTDILFLGDSARALHNKVHSTKKS